MKSTLTPHRYKTPILTGKWFKREFFHKHLLLKAENTIESVSGDTLQSTQANIATTLSAHPCVVNNGVIQT